MADTPAIASSRRRAAHRRACWLEIYAIAGEIAALTATAGRAAAALAQAKTDCDSLGDTASETCAALDIDDLVSRMRHLVSATQIVKR